MLFKDIIESWREYHKIVEDLRLKNLRKYTDDDIIQKTKKLIEEVVCLVDKTNNFQEYGKVKEVYYACDKFLLEEFGMVSGIIFPPYKRN